MSFYIYPDFDDYNELLKSELEEKKFIDKININIPKIESILKHLLFQLNKDKDLSFEDIDKFTKSIEFIDNLNIFINNSELKNLLNLIKDFRDKLNKGKVKEDLIQKINTTEKNVVTYKIKFYRDLYFTNSNEIKNSINQELNEVSKNDFFDAKLFKQIQNIFWILKNKMLENDRKYIENKIFKLKKERQDYYNYKNSNNNYNNSYYYSNKHYYKNNYYYNNNYKNSYKNFNFNQYKKYPKMIEIEIPSNIENCVDDEKKSDTNSIENKETNSEEKENINNLQEQDKNKITNMSIININNSNNINNIDKVEDFSTIDIKINNINNNIKKNKVENPNEQDIIAKNFSKNNYIFLVNNLFSNNPQMLHEELSNNESKMQKSDINLKEFISIHFEYDEPKKKIIYDYLCYKINLCKNYQKIILNIKQFEEKIIFPLYERITSKASQEKKNLDYIFYKYTKIINKVLNKFDIIEEIAPYGSYVNNFMGEKGDIDICIIPKIPWYSCRGYARKINSYIKNHYIGHITLFHKSKNFFLISICDNETKKNIDITIHNYLPVINSQIIKIYSQFDKRFHIMGIYIKYWAKLNQVHGAAYSYLSSYALILMIIHFLQNVIKPRILPNLQKIPVNDDFDNPIFKDNIYKYYNRKKQVSTNLYFESDMKKIENYLNYINKGEKNEESVGNLILKFFEYYSYFYDDKYLISIKRNSLEECLKEKKDNYAFSIEDPFELNKNPGSSMTKNRAEHLYFVECMRKEINSILLGKNIKE
jgi:DNA polymerase sigma